MAMPTWRWLTWAVIRSVSCSTTKPVALRLAVSYATGVLPASVLAKDLNGDGLLDLTVANLGDGTVGVLLGKGDGTFLNQTTYPAGTQPYTLLSADFNGRRSGRPGGHQLL